jgi:hypothetical protein
MLTKGGIDRILSNVQEMVPGVALQASRWLLSPNRSLTNFIFR